MKGARAIAGATLGFIGCALMIAQIVLYLALLAAAVWVVKWAWLAF